MCVREKGEREEGRDRYPSKIDIDIHRQAGYRGYLRDIHTTHRLV